MTYRRDPNSPMSEALCSMRSDPDAEALRFFTEAWKAAYGEGEVTRLALTRHSSRTQFRWREKTARLDKFYRP